MSTYFFDSSALAKRYHREIGSSWVSAVCSSRMQPILYISAITEIEVTAALRRAARINQYHPSFADMLTKQFIRDILLSNSQRKHPVYKITVMQPSLLTTARQLCIKYWQLAPYPLRSLDAIQLASAITARSASSEDVVFVTADRRLGAIAPLEGFTVINPEVMPRTVP